MNKIFRYSYDLGEFGGVVFADNEQDAKKRIQAAYKDIGHAYTDGNGNYLLEGELNMEVLEVWAVDEDEMGEIFRKHQVLDIYGI